MEKGRALHLNKLESPSPKDTLCQVWLKLAQWFWRRRFFYFVNVFSLFRNYLPFEKAGPFIWTNLNPLHPGMLCAKFGWNWPIGSGEEDENVKSLQTDRQTDRQTDGRTDGRTDRQTTDDRWSEKLTWAFSSDELKTLISIKHVLWNVRFSYQLFFLAYCGWILCNKFVMSPIRNDIKFASDLLIRDIILILINWENT